MQNLISDRHTETTTTDINNVIDDEVDLSIPLANQSKSTFMKIKFFIVYWCFIHIKHNEPLIDIQITQYIKTVLFAASKRG